MEEFPYTDQKLDAAARPIKLGFGCLLAFAAVLMIGGFVRFNSVPYVREVPFFERTSKQHDEHFELTKRQNEAQFSGWAMMAFGGFLGFTALMGLKSTSRRMNRASAAIKVAAMSDWVDTVAQAQDLRHNAADLMKEGAARLSSGVMQGARGTPTQRLAELKEMHQQQLISEAEFEAKRTEILREL